MDPNQRTGKGPAFSYMMTYSFCFFGYLFKKKFDRSINDFQMHLVAKKYWKRDIFQSI